MKKFASLLCLAAIAGSIIAGPSVLAQEKPTAKPGGKTTAVKMHTKKKAKKMKHKAAKTTAAKSASPSAAHKK